jgi:hypothetical protein
VAIALALTGSVLAVVLKRAIPEQLGGQRGPGDLGNRRPRIEARYLPG